MSVQSEIDRIKGNIAGAYTAVSEMGGEAPESAGEQNSANLAASVRSIPSGGMTQEEADARYLKLSGGTMGGPPTLNNSGISISGIGVRGGRTSWGSFPASPTDGSAGALELPISFSGENISAKSVIKGIVVALENAKARIYPTGYLYDGELESNSVQLCGVADPTRNSAVANKRYVDQRLPSGAIILWSGTTAPTGWTLCNGSNGAPNLSAPSTSVRYIMKL